MQRKIKTVPNFTNTRSDPQPPPNRQPTGRSRARSIHHMQAPLGLLEAKIIK
jgi:hypothetical protein